MVGSSSLAPVPSTFASSSSRPLAVSAAKWSSSRGKEIGINSLPKLYSGLICTSNSLPAAGHLVSKEEKQQQQLSTDEVVFLGVFFAATNRRQQIR